MKKGLLLSIVASTVLFAGGDIAPVEPVAEAPAAACNDFYGHAGVGVIYVSGENTDTNTTASVAAYGAVAVLGVNKEIFSGLTFNAEVQGGAIQTYVKDGDTDGVRSPFHEFGALTEFNLGYSWCNTAIKVGRFSVPKALSPLAYTGTDYFGLKNATFEGVLVANTDIPDTTIWAAYLHNKVAHATTDNLGLILNDKTSQRVRVGVIAAGLQNKSFADTTITLAGYYDLNGTGNQPWTWAVAGSVDKKWCDTDLSLGGAYIAYDDNTTGAQAGNDYVIGAYIKQNFDASYIKLGATYGDMGYSKYTTFTWQDTNGTNTWAVGAEVGTTLSGYKLKAFGQYRQNESYRAGAGISKTVSGINLALDYRYEHNTANKINSHRVRASAVYKF